MPRPTRRLLLALALAAPLLACGGAPASGETKNGDKATGQGDAITVFVVRHAEKRTDPDADPKNPELTEAGERRAQALPGALPLERIKAIFSTGFKRTRATVAHVATATKLETELYEPVAFDDLIGRIGKHPGAAVLVAGHSNTVPKMLTAFGVTETIEIPDEQYGDLFVVTLKNGAATLERRRFGD